MDILPFLAWGARHQREVEMSNNQYRHTQNPVGPVGTITLILEGRVEGQAGEQRPL